MRQAFLPGLQQPNTALVMSALIKSIRLRRTDDALKWFMALWAFPSLRERVARRILISSAEDGFSRELISKVAHWYRGPSRLLERCAAAEIVRICASPSWWASREGHEYIFVWLSAERVASQGGAMSFACLERNLDAFLEAGEMVKGIAAFVQMSLDLQFSNVRIADQLGRWAERIGSERTLTLFDDWRAVAPALGRDGNIAGLLLYDLLGGAIPSPSIPDVSPASVQLTANYAWDGAEVGIPSWANDGIHAQGRGAIDARFAGLVPNFARMCLAHSMYGRLVPDDSWQDLPPI